MNKQFLTQICHLIGNDDPLKCTSEHEAIQMFVVPKILKHYKERKNQRISDDFMQLMACHGSVILQDNLYGVPLFEFALQRISCGGVVHKRLEKNNNFSYTLWDYSAIHDAPAPMNRYDFLFLFNQLQAIRTKEDLQDHLKLILFGIINNLSEDGKELYANTLAPDIHPPSLYNMAWSAIRKFYTVSEIAKTLGTPQGIIKYNTWFRAHWDKFDHAELYSQLGISGCFKERKLKKMIFYDLPIVKNPFEF